MRDELIKTIKSALSGWVLSHIAEKLAPRIADELIRTGAVKALEN